MPDTKVSERKQAHTPGPWTTHGSHVYAPDKAIIAVVHNPGSHESDYPLVSNLRLIAAAPEMLEALAVWHEYWDDRYDGEPLKDYEIKMLAVLRKLGRVE